MIQQNSFPQGLDSLRIPSIAGELRMYANRGFFDFETLDGYRREWLAVSMCKETTASDQSLSAQYNHARAKAQYRLTVAGAMSMTSAVS